jgi:FkbM family methyltransferase
MGNLRLRAMIDGLASQDRQALESAARRMCQTARLSDDQLICRVLGKYIMYVDPRDRGITPHLALNGFWEAWVTVALARLVQPGWRCVDVGANVGYFTVLIADAVGPDGRVAALEPNPAIAQWLELNVYVNGFGRWVDIHRVAAADSDGSDVDLVVDATNPGVSTICAAAGRSGDAVAALTATVDRLTAAWPVVNLVKIDAEGAEPAIWNGMRRTLACNPDVVVLMEFTPSLYADPLGFLDEIEAAGFALRQVAADGNIVPLLRDTIAVFGAAGGWTMLFLARH